MTAFNGFDLVDARVVGALDEIAAATRPDYLDDIFQVTARTRQRPRWTFFERWLPMDSAAARPAGRLRAPLRPLAILLILTLLAVAATAIFVGSRNRPLAPFGPADNGQVVYGSGGDLFVRDSLTADPRLLIGGPGEQGGALFSNDGRLIAYDNVVGGVDAVTVANADGSNPRQILAEPFTGGSATWSPDSSSMALTTTSALGARRLWIAPADGSGAKEIRVDGIWPLDVLYNPADDGTLLIRGHALLEGVVDLYLIDQSGQVLREYDVPGTMVYGADWELAGVAFSPDGRTIAYNSVEEIPDGARFRANLVDVDGTHRRALPVPAGAPADYSQAWSVFSPDGKWILMESWVGAPGGPSTNQVAVAPADGSAPARGIGPSVVNQSLLRSWSPDGTKVLVGVVDVNDTYEVDPTTGKFVKLPWNGDMPAWQRTLR